MDGHFSPDGSLVAVTDVAVGRRGCSGWLAHRWQACGQGAVAGAGAAAVAGIVVGVGMAMANKAIKNAVGLGDGEEG